MSHPEQLERLGSACPEAVPTAVLAGDPCYDRLLAALPQRAAFRRALGVGPEQRLVVLSSTWSPRSLFGDSHDGTIPEGGDDTAAGPLPWLLPRIASELPADEYRTVAVLHPNIWYGHGPGQLRAWLERARRAGLTLIPPLEGWRQALIAADCVLGDHGSVTFYAASLGTPVLLAAFPDGDLDPGSPVAALGRAAPRLRPYGSHGSLRAQIDHVVDAHERDRYAALAAQTSSSPGESAGLLRGLFYGLIGIPEPARHAARLDPLPLPPYEPAERTAPVRVLTQLVDTGPPEVAVTRYAGPVHEPEDTGPEAAHLAVPEDTADTGQLSTADVIVRTAAEDDPRMGPPAAWTADVLARHPYCALAVYVTGVDRCTVRIRGGTLLRLTAAPYGDGRARLCDPAAYASALHAWLAAGKPLEDTAHGITVRTGAARHRVTVERLRTDDGAPRG
ncbi:hypothetical protein DVA86_34015 [Streptomyces armeniacus]|uniref:Translation initiation factor 2 n=1 Tax=Streptomyces armeniacus TaxID=83291 RepID=A0A345Y1V5_9ACTN|nr:hypothetical protein DVA86_34015 [Streptomyces armeniacus]